MIGVGWPIEDFPPGGEGETSLLAGIVGLLLLLAFAGLVVWRERHGRRHQAALDAHIEHPADFRKAA